MRVKFEIKIKSGDEIRVVVSSPDKLVEIHEVRAQAAAPESPVEDDAPEEGESDEEPAEPPLPRPPVHLPPIHHRPPMHVPGLLTALEVGEALGVSRWTVYRLMKDGTLPFLQVRGTRRVERADVERYQDALKKQGRRRRKKR